MDIVFDYILLREKNNDHHCHTICTMETQFTLSLILNIGFMIMITVKLWKKNEVFMCNTSQSIQMRFKGNKKY